MNLISKFQSLSNEDKIKETRSNEFKALIKNKEELDNPETSSSTDQGLSEVVNTLQELCKMLKTNEPEILNHFDKYNNLLEDNLKSIRSHCPKPAETLDESTTQIPQDSTNSREENLNLGNDFSSQRPQQTSRGVNNSIDSHLENPDKNAKDSNFRSYRNNVNQPNEYPSERGNLINQYKL